MDIFFFFFWALPFAMVLIILHAECGYLLFIIYSGCSIIGLILKFPVSSHRLLAFHLFWLRTVGDVTRMKAMKRLALIIFLLVH